MPMQENILLPLKSKEAKNVAGFLLVTMMFGAPRYYIQTTEKSAKRVIRLYDQSSKYIIRIIVSKS